MWQMTMLELISDSYKPEVKYNWANGLSDWFCPVCGQCVGIYSNGQTHNEGWLYKRDECKNGHRIGWGDNES